LSTSDSEGPVPKHDPLAALRQRSVQLYSARRIFVTLGQTLLQAVMAWQVYEFTGSALSLGLVGLARFLSALSVSNDLRLRRRRRLSAHSDCSS